MARLAYNGLDGLPRVVPIGIFWTGDEIVKFAFEHGVRKEPWHGMEYSNTGYVLAGRIIEHETGAPYAAHLRKRIFEPLGMNDTWVGT